MRSKLLSQNVDKTEMVTPQYHLVLFISRFRVQDIVVLHDSTGKLIINKAWNITTYLISDLVAKYIIIQNILFFKKRYQNLTKFIF